MSSWMGSRWPQPVIPTDEAIGWCMTALSTQRGKGPSQGTSAAGRVQACGHRQGQSRSELPLNGCLCSGSGGGVLSGSFPSSPAPRRTSWTGHWGRGGPAQGKVQPCPSRVGPCAWALGDSTRIGASGVRDTDWAQAAGAGPGHR